MMSDEMSHIIYADGWKNNPGNSSTTKIGEHIPGGYSMPTIWAFNNIENKPTIYILGKIV